jgi:hypothetical protein
MIWIPAILVALAIGIGAHVWTNSLGRPVVTQIALRFDATMHAAPMPAFLAVYP